MKAQDIFVHLFYVWRLTAEVRSHRL